MKCSVIISIVLTLTMLATGTAQASLDKIKARNETQRQQQYAKLLELRAGIEANGGSQIAQIEEYLTTAANLVYLAKVRANYDFGADITTTNNDLTSLVSLGYLPAWPGNPFDDWKPMQVLSVDDAFASGNLVFELCPAEEFTSFGNERYLGSFNLYIYGFEGRGRTAKSVSTGPHKDWSRVPNDTFYSLSFNMRSDAQAARDQQLIEKLGRENFKPATDS